MKGLNRDEAVIRAIKDCRENGILVEFVQKYGSEAVNMLYTQWNWDDAMAVEREEAYEEGDLNRSRQSVLDLLEDLGEIPEDIRYRIDIERSTEVLRKWHKAAAKAQSFEIFREAMK